MNAGFARRKSPSATGNSIMFEKSLSVIQLAVEKNIQISDIAVIATSSEYCLAFSMFTTKQVLDVIILEGFNIVVPQVYAYEATLSINHKKVIYQWYEHCIFKKYT